MKVFKGEERLVKVFWLYGLVCNWLLPFVLGFLLVAVLTPEKPENVWFYVFFCAVMYNLLFNYLCMKNSDNRSERGITAFAAMVWVSWPFVLAVLGVVFGNVFGTPEML